MKEKRIDKINNDIVILAMDRAKRPMDKINSIEESEIHDMYDKNCPFCRGNEKYTPEDTFKIESSTGWIVRSTKNKFPIVDESAEDICGNHEVLIDTYRHNGNFYNMNQIEYENMLIMYIDRYREFIEDENTEYVSIFKNFMRKAGASLSHPHSQIISLPLIPPDLENELEIGKKYYLENNRCLYMDLIKEEIENKDRVIHNGENFLVIVPYATRYSGEVRILFKKKIRFESINDECIKELAFILDKLFDKLEMKRGISPFNLYIHNYPKNIDSMEYFNVHIHIIPRQFNFGGFELSTGMYVTSLSPEEFAKSLRF